MKKIESVLFQGITENEWMHMLDLGCMRTQHFAKNTIIFHTGEHIHEIGIVLSGSVNIENIDLWGNKSILSNISAGQVFAESYALCQEPMMVDAVTAEAADILFLNIAPLKQVQDKESWSAKIMQNILYISVQKNLILSRRIFCTTPKTVRSRLFIYLSTEAAKMIDPNYVVSPTANMFFMMVSTFLITGLGWFITDKNNRSWMVYN